MSTKTTLSALCALLVWAVSPGIACSEETVQWKPLEIRLTAQDQHPWWRFPVQSTFTHQTTGQSLVLEAWWDGGREWVVRFAAPLPGAWTWQTASRDAGMAGRTGRIDVRCPTAQELAANPNYRGHLQIAVGDRHFAYADGTPFFLLADTLWAGNTARCGVGDQQDGPFYQYLADRQAKGFTAVLIKYLHGFGDVPRNPPGERNEGGYAFHEQDFTLLNPAYFRGLDQRLAGIWSRGLVAAIPTAWWGKTRQCVFDIEWAKRISAYCAVRYGAFNALWCLSGEYQYAFGDCGWTPADFDDLGNTVQAHNPYRHPLSIHPSGRIDWSAPHNCQSSRPFHASAWLDHHWLQTGQSIDRMFNIVGRADENRTLAPARPVFCSEAYYDVADDPDQAYHARWQAWTAFLSGCCGYGYGAQGMWQFYDSDDPAGETGMKDTRVVRWSEALEFEGAAMMRYVHDLLTAHPWWRLEPDRARVLVGGRPSPRPQPKDLTPPSCAAIAGELAIVYIPRGNRSRVLELIGPGGGRCRAEWYSPRTGETTPAAGAPGAQAKWTIPDRPAPPDEDWVLVISADESHESRATH